MAGMEELEIHSRSYLVRWVNVKPEHTISWSIQPHKKSLNFGIFKHPGAGGASSTNPSSLTQSVPFASNDPHDKENQKAAQSSAAVIEKLKGIGLKPIQWIGKCEADKISQGTHDVGINDAGNYALVFDNTFSKQVSKTATFVLLTYPTSSPPQSGHQIHHSQAMAGLNASSQNLASESSESLKRGRGLSMSGHGNNTKNPPQTSDSSNTSVHTGILQKRRRKRHQGYARRFFSLDFASSTLSYYHDRNSSALRGAIPLTLAAIAANDKTREISIDSGVEIWHLRAPSDGEFKSWKRALEKASKPQENGSSEPRLRVRTQSMPQRNSFMGDPRDFAQVETLVQRLSTSRDLALRLAKDTDPKYLTTSLDRRNRSPSPGALATQSPNSETNGDDSADSKDKRSFWRRRHKDTSNAMSQISKRNVSSSQVTPQSAPDTPTITTQQVEPGVHDGLMTLLHNLDSIVTEFSALLDDKKRSKLSVPSPVQPRASFESDVSEEFFDAEDGNLSPLLTIQRDSDDEKSDAEAAAEDDESLSESDVEDADAFTRSGFKLGNSSSLFPAKPKSLVPLPLKAVSRRTKVISPTVLPPSLISFLRKNVGKDLSTISMPVSANEPLSLLQRAAEQFEYSQLLDKAANATDALERLIYVTAFAISPISNSRVRERAIRKPFNPMLGETFELIREDKGFRFIAEKVSHRPVQLAYQADSTDWSFAQSTKPSQKFWGKSAEIITEGKARLTLHSSGEHFSWSNATCFLRNIIAGEKYVEPVGEMCLLNETTGQKTIATFKAGGMFSGRSEEVTVKAFDTHGGELPLGLQGTWTSSLQLTQHGNVTNKTIWAAGDLVDKASKNYGFTAFAVGLNEITAIEEGKLPPTDSRLRPDQRALENGDLDKAEDLKARLEERQRERRREMEAKGESHRPRWFSQVEGQGGEDAVWKLRTGKDGYWEERAKGEFTGTLPVLKT